MGTDKPYLFRYNKKIYVYGGFSSVGYTTSYNTLFAVYDPIYNKWSPVAKNYSSATVGQTDGCIFQINGKIYIGGGYNNETNSSPASYNNSIYSMLLQ
jgi:N-acetylneuraminic acid mutarotase